MNRITHKKAIKLIHGRLDGLLKESQVLSLEQHLRSCDSCRLYAAEMDLLPTRLQNEFHARWDEKPGPSPKVIEHVTAKARRIPMTNQISSGAKLFAGATALIVMAFLANFVISQLRSTSVSGTETAPDSNGTPASSFGSENRLLAFTSEQNGNFDIYTIRPDGTDLTNLTNNPAHDANPIWSPDGKHIAFESNRNGFMQIYLMDADGSNVIQFTNDKADHSLPLNIDGKSNPWSPDGSKLLFLQSSAGGELGNLYAKEANGENKVLLASGRFSHNDLSWSPNGTYIAYVLNESPTPNETFVTGLYVVDSNGNNPQELKKLIPQNENLGSPYYWSSDGQSIVFITDKNDGLGQTVYEFDLETNTLLQKDMLKQGVIDWQDKISLISERSAFVWQRSNGRSNTLDWDDPNCLLDITRSLHGNFAIGAYCPDSKKFKLYWANSDGSTIKQLLDSSTLIGQLWDIAWSPDDQYIAFNIISDKTSMYIVNVKDALQDSSVQPTQVVIGGGELYTIPAWQPIANENVTKEIPTPKPISTSSYSGLIAFTSASENGDLDIYTMRSGGSELTNLTNHPANDVNPFWSPDGKRIAFESDRNGFKQIYLMDADGSNVTQLTNNEAHHEFGSKYGSSYSPWSPDRSKLIFLQLSEGQEKSVLYSIDINSEEEIPLVNEPNMYHAISWSPDGQHIALIANDPQNPDVLRLYVVNTDGSNRRDITKSMQANERLDDFSYDWSADGKSIFFIAYKHINEGNDQWIAYEASVDGNTLVERAVSSTPMHSWWDRTSFIIGFDSSLLTWLRSDGTYSTLKPLENCHMANDSYYGFVARRSFNGDLMIGVDCPNDDLLFYWANSDGTFIKQLFDSPMSVKDGGLNDIVWSPDNKYIAINVYSVDVTYTYVVNVEESLKDPSALPDPIGRGAIGYSVSWQPNP